MGRRGGTIMKGASLLASEKLEVTNSSGLQTATTSLPKMETKSRSGKPAWNALPLQSLEQRAEKLARTHALIIYPKTIRKTGRGYFMVLTKCRLCGTEAERELRNLEKGFSSKCPCQHRGRQSPKETRRLLRMLSERFHSMKQRCERDTHCSSARYKGRGIKVLFRCVDEFRAWTLTKYPELNEETLKRLEFDREDNNGHYCPENLRLVPRTVNLFNTRRTLKINRQHARAFMKKYPEVTYTEDTVLGFLQVMTEEKLLEHHRNSPRAVGRRKIRNV